MSSYGGYTRSALRFVRAVAGDPRRVLRALSGIPAFTKSAYQYHVRRRESGSPQFELSIRRLYPCLTDARDAAGKVGQYFTQDLWAAKKIYEKRPDKHVDIGSRVDGFIGHLLVFMHVEVIDIRPLPNPIDGLSLVVDDATALTQYPNDSVESLSSLHAVEHFGLGRYGDPVDPEGWRKAIDSIKRVIAPGGRVYFSVPVGRERLEFNAHRIFAPGTILAAFEGMRLREFSVVDAQGRLARDVEPADYSDAYNVCGLFEFEK